MLMTYTLAQVKKLWREVRQQIKQKPKTKTLLKKALPQPCLPWKLTNTPLKLLTIFAKSFISDV